MPVRPLTLKNSVTVECSNCTKPFLMLRLRFNERTKRRPDAWFFCSVTCDRQKRGEKIGAKKLQKAIETGHRLKVPCATCGKEVELIKFHLKEKNFCSNACTIPFLAQKNREKECPDAYDKWRKDVEIPEDLEGCWVWKGTLDGWINNEHRNKNGHYGLFHWPRGGTMGAHVASYRLHTGDHETKGWCICHTCDNPICVNPNHLFKGTNEENQLDALVKGRLKVGSQHWMAKFTDDQVREMRKLHSEGVTCKQLGEEYGAHEGTISKIVNGKTYYQLHDDKIKTDETH